MKSMSQQFKNKFISLISLLLSSFILLSFKISLISILYSTIQPSSVNGFEILYNVDFTSSIVCDNLFTVGKWSPVIEQFVGGGQCSYKCETSIGDINLFSPDVKKYTKGVQLQAQMPQKQYSFINVDILYFQTSEDITITLFDQSTQIVQKTLLNSNQNNPSKLDLPYDAKCVSSFTSSDELPIQQFSLDINKKITNSLVFRIYQPKNTLNSQWYGLFKLRIYSNCVENCLDCSAEKVCQKCMFGFELILNASGLYSCTQTGSMCSAKIPNCQTCSISSDGTAFCVVCLPSYILQDTPNACISNPNTKPCSANQYYSGCDDSCKKYSQNSFKNSFDNQNIWISSNSQITNGDGYKCPYQKQILVHSIKNYSIYTCGCAIAFCEICTKATGCDSCQLGYQYNSATKECVFDSCPLYYYKNTSSKCVFYYDSSNKELTYLNSINITSVCQKCFSSKCQQCVDDGIYSCKICKAGYYMYKGQCISNCPKNNQYNSDNQCYDCADSNCESCKGISATDCIKCNSSTYLNKGKCVSECQNNQVDGNRECFECQDNLNCIACSSPNQCIQCSQTTYLKNGSCVNSCGQGYFEMTLPNGSKICKQCYDKDNCLTCSNELESGCITCSNTTFLDNGKCVNQCKNNQFNSSTRKCYLCADDINCSYCTDSTEFSCQSCTNSTYLDKTGKCVVQCPKNQYDANNKCFDCFDNQNCLKCSDNGQSSCTECTSGTNLVNGTCKLPCLDGQYQLQDKSCGNCQDQYNCLNCINNDQDACIKCKQNMYLQNGICVSECSSHLYNELNVCYSCFDSNCLECPNTLENSCTKCSNTKYLNNGKCVDECDKKQFNQQRQCFQCYDEINCVNCSSSNKDGCVECDSNKVVKDGICVQSCGLGYYIDESQPSNIDISKKQRICKKCSDFDNCLDCSNNGNYCNTCSNTTFNQNGQCVLKCDKENQFDSSRHCYECNDTNCEVCSSYNIGDCSKCKNDTFLNKANGTCVQQCYQDQYDEQNICFECFDNQNCLKCNSNKENSCQICKSGFIQKEGKCLNEQDCGHGYYLENNQYKHCVKCYDFNNCSKCSDDQQYSCTECTQNLFLNENGECVTKCENDQYDSQRKCYKCDDKRCKFCTSNSINSCRVCQDSYQYKGSCIDKCNNDQYDENNNCIECFDQVNCSKCSNSSKDGCILCNNDYKLQDGYCVQGCSENYYTEVLPNNLTRCSNCLTIPSTMLQLKDEQCKECQKLLNCNLCDKQKQCTQCDNNFKLKNGECVTECGLSFVEMQNNSTSQCQPCFDQDKCERCDTNESGKCTQCQKNYILFNGICIQQCPKGFGLKNKTEEKRECVKCENNNCNICHNQYQICQECKMYYTLNLLGQCIEDIQLDYTLQQQEDNNLNIIFNRNIENLNEIIEKIIDVKLNIQKAYEDKYTYKYQTLSNNQVQVNFYFTSSYAGQSDVQVIFQQKQQILQFQCQEPDKHILISFNQNIDTKTLQTAQTIGQVNTAASQVAVNSILPLAFSGQFAFIATVVDITEILQLMEYTSSMQPWNTKIFYDSLQKFSVPFWNVFQYMENLDQIDEQGVGNFAQDNEISGTFLIQGGEHFTIALICVFANLINLVLLHQLKNKLKPLQILKKLNEYVNPIRLSSEVLWTVYYDISLAFFLQIMNMNNNLEQYPTERIINYIITFLSLIIISLPILVAIWIKQEKYPKITEQFTEGLSSKYFWIFFYLRRIYCVSIIVLFQFNGYAQITLLTIFHIVHLVLSICFKPYKEQSQNIRNYLQAILLIIGTVMMYPLVDYSSYSDEQQINFGWSQCAPFICIVAIELLYFIASLSYSIYTFTVKSYKYIQKRKQVQPINTINSPSEPVNKLHKLENKQKLGENTIQEQSQEDEDVHQQNQIDQKREKDFTRLKTEDLVLRTQDQVDPLSRQITNTGEDFRTRQFSTNSPIYQSKFNLQTEDTEFNSPKKSSVQSNFNLDSPSAETNSLFASRRASPNKFLSSRKNTFKPTKIVQTTLNELEFNEYCQQVDSQKDNLQKKEYLTPTSNYSNSNKVKFSLSGNNQNLNHLNNDQNYSEFQHDDSQMSPIRFDGNRLLSPSASRMNISLIKSTDNLQIARERNKTIQLKKIEDEENEEETPIIKPIKDVQIIEDHQKEENQSIKNGQIISLDQQGFSLENNMNLNNQPQKLSFTPSPRKKVSRITTLLKMTRIDQNKNNAVLENINNIQVIELNQIIKKS